MSPRCYASPNSVGVLTGLALLAGPHSSPELVESLQDFGRLTLISVLGLDADHLDLKTDLMLDFTVGGMLAVLRRWPKLHEQLPMDTVFNEDLAVLATGMFMSMSKTDMLGYWKRIFSSGFVPGPGVSRRPSPAIRRTVSHTPHCVTFRW